jgi:hypothetical protein
MKQLVDIGLHPPSKQDYSDEASTLRDLSSRQCE